MSHLCDDYYLDSDDDDDPIVCVGSQISSDSEENDDPSSFIASHRANKRKTSRKKDADPGDEFANEMSEELSILMKSLTKPLPEKIPNSSDTASTSSGKKKVTFSEETKSKENIGQTSQEPSEYYDDIYFDTDDSEGDDEIPSNTQKKKEKRRFLTDDELLYDPQLDEEDQAWVDKSRRSYHLKPNKKLLIDGKPFPLPPSDAVLNCPACFTTLCHDCQRHEFYKNQYRAMFVFNCTIDFSEKLHIPKKKSKKFKRKDAESKKPPPQSDPNSTEFNFDDASPEDIFYPVVCEICNTKVGVYDQEEVYHFFNILTSY